MANAKLNGKISWIVFYAICKKRDKLYFVRLNYLLAFLTQPLKLVQYFVLQRYFNKTLIFILLTKQPPNPRRKHNTNG